MNKLPRDIILIISKMHPLIIPPFTNKTLRRAVKDYLAGGDRKKRIVEKYGEISNWDTSKVTNMHGLFFCNARSFNQPLNKWNVSKVTDMAWMFYGARSFNQPLDKWNVSNVRKMRCMFHLARSFNQLLNNWDVSNVEDMFGMFWNARSFNQPLNDWNVSKVTNMKNMFYGTESFNQPLDKWDVSHATLGWMFDCAVSFNQPLHAPWYVGNVCASKHERNLLELFGLRFSNILNGR